MMRRRRAGFSAAITALVVAAAVLGAVPRTLRADDTRKSATVERARAAALRGLAFTEKDAADWRATKKCASCHHGIMTAWTFAEARERGYPMRAELLAQTFAWCRERFTTIDQPRGADPNSRAISTAALMFGLMALTNPGQTSLAPDELARIGTHFVNTQDTNGSWTWSVVPPANRPPPVSESDEVATLMAYLCLEGGLPADRRQTSPAAVSREKAAAWLAGTPAGDSTQSAALRLYISARDGSPRQQREAAIAALLARQNADGGWSQTRELASDGFATGQVLYFLHLSGLKADRAEMKRGIAFLVANQREDGSWKVIPRAQPGAQPFTHPEPIVSFGTAWATMALMRLVPPGE
jgi:hypothetical protein